MQWLYLIAASLLEVGWIFSLKKLSFTELKKISVQVVSQHPVESAWVILPFLGYVLFGTGNIYFFSLAMKQISASTAFAIWMALTLVGVKLIEVIFYKEAIKPLDYVFLALLVVAIIGLKKSS
ncbi:MAG: DMT family transporter [Cyclobacteriaceae bacterium]